MPERQVITSLTGTASPLLTVDTANLQALDYSSFFLPREWKKSTPFVVDELAIQANGQTGLGIDMSFEIPKFGHLLMDLCYHWVAPPRTTTVGFNAFYVDFLGYAALDFFSVLFSANMLFDRRAQDLYFKFRQTYGIEKAAGIDFLVRGDQTLAQRTADLANGVELWVDLMLPFSSHFNMSLPIVVLSQKTRFNMRLHALNNITNIQPFGVPGGSVTTSPGLQDFIELWAKVVHVTGNEADLLIAMSRSDSGIAYMIHQPVRQATDDFASTQNGYQINEKLNGITKPIRYLEWALCPRNLINFSGRQDQFFFAPQPVIGPFPPGASPYNPIVSWSITANGQIVQRTVLRNYNRVYDHVKYNDSIYGDEIFRQFYSQYPHSVNAACGYLDYTTLNNPVLQITMGTGGTGLDPDQPPVPGTVAQQLRVVVNCEDYNFWFLKSGNWSRTFN
jgi:hypothetical protein